MTINTEITDAQAAALAQLNRVTSYTDGNDLMQQVALAAELQAAKIATIEAVALASEVASVNAAATAYSTASGKAVALPPIKAQ